MEGADPAYEDREEEYAAGLRAWDGLPGIPASAGALVRDAEGRILLLKPTYKKGWTIPGGVMEADGETPWQACQRELREETGLTVTAGRLAAVDTRPAKSRKAMGLRFLFDCGTVSEAQIATITLQREELSTYAFVAPAEALTMLRPAVSRRVAAVLDSHDCRYLEDGRSLPEAPTG
jgi:ADP-ribose pyrophosphatase YjhB (NUDIX family)